MLRPRPGHCWPGRAVFAQHLFWAHLPNSSGKPGMPQPLRGPCIREDPLRETAREDTPRATVEASMTVACSSPQHTLSPATVALANSLWQLLAPLGMGPFCLTSLDLSLGVSLKLKGCCACQGLAKLYREKWRCIDCRLSALPGWPLCGLPD